jgi:hypothetical protein
LLLNDFEYIPVQYKNKKISQSGKVLFDRRAPVEIFYDNDSAEIKRNSLLSNKKRQPNSR